MAVSVPVRPLRCRRRPAQAADVLLYLRATVSTIYDKLARMSQHGIESTLKPPILSTSQVYWLFVLLTCSKGAKSMDLALGALRGFLV